MNGKRLKYTLAFVIGFIVGAYCFYLYSKKDKGQENSIIITHSLIVDKIESLGNLEVAKYNIQDIIEYEKMRQWLPNAKTALLIRGEVIACIDLTKIEQNHVSISGDSIALLLQPPQICHVKVNHSQSKIYDISYGLWESAQLLDEAYKHAEKELIFQANKSDITEEAKKNTVAVLTPLLTTLGFNHVTILFNDKLPRN